MTHRAAPKLALDEPLSSRSSEGLFRPQQDRSRKTLERLLDATEAIIRDEGIEAVTIPAVTRAARSSVGSFYARFPDKASLLRALHERACAQTVAMAESALDPTRWEGEKTSDVLRAFVELAVRRFADRRPMMLAFSAALGDDAGFAERRAQAAATVGRALRRLFASRGRTIGHPHPPLAVEMALRVVTATLEQRTALEASHVDEVAIGDEVLTRELTRVVLGYLDVR